MLKSDGAGSRRRCCPLCEGWCPERGCTGSTRSSALAATPQCRMVYRVFPGVRRSVPARTSPVTKQQNILTAWHRPSSPVVGVSQDRHPPQHQDDGLHALQRTSHSPEELRQRRRPHVIRIRWSPKASTLLHQGDAPDLGVSGVSGELYWRRARPHTLFSLPERSVSLPHSTAHACVLPDADVLRRVCVCVCVSTDLFLVARDISLLDDAAKLVFQQFNSDPCGERRTPTSL